MNSDKRVYPVDVCKSVHPIDVCKPVCLVDIRKPFFVDYQKHVILFLILLPFVASVNTPSSIHLLKGNNRNIRTSCEICSKLTIKTPERRHCCCSGVFVILEHISHFVLRFLMLTLSM